MKKTTDSKNSIFDELDDRDRRKTNLIVSGLEEKKGGAIEDRKAWDKSLVRKLLVNLDLTAQDEYEDMVATRKHVSRWETTLGWKPPS